MGMFRFTGLFGARATPRAEEPPPEDDTTGAEDGTGDDDTTAEDGEDDTASEDGTDDDTTAEEEDAPAAQDDAAPPAEAKIRAKERARIGRIMTSKAARGRTEAALHLAVNTAMSSRAAVALLGTLPKAGAAPAATAPAGRGGKPGGLAARMAGVPGAAVGPGGGGEAAPGTGGPLSFRQIQDRRALRADAAAIAAAAGGVFTPRRR